jgi:hypothetical protein
MTRLHVSGCSSWLWFDVERHALKGIPHVEAEMFRRAVITPLMNTCSIEHLRFVLRGEITLT